MRDCIYRDAAIENAISQMRVSKSELCMRERLMNLPAADVAPVVHGRWEHKINGIIPSGQCSNCKAWDKITLFCPNCGALMEGNDGLYRES